MATTKSGAKAVGSVGGQWRPTHKLVVRWVGCSCKKRMERIDA